MTQPKYRRMLAISTLSLVMLVGNTLSLPASALAAPTETSQAQTVKPIANLTSKTVMGLDLSEYQQYLTDYQKQYYNFKGDALGTSQALMLFLKNCGVNTISVKVAVDPASNNKKTLSLDSAAKTLAAAKKAGLKTNVVLLYSDEMTYAKTQTLPTKWQQLKPAELLDTAKNYTEKTLMSLKAAAAQPDIVTIGHDVNYNFLGLTGNDTNEWNGYYDMAQLSQVVTKLDSHTQVALGLATPKVNDFQWVLQALGKVQAKYNILGLTVYPTDETNADIAKLRDQFTQVAPDKQLVVSGVKFAKQSDDKTASVAKQTANIYQLLASTVNAQNAGGIILDDAISAGSWTSLFAADGYPEHSLAVFNTAKGVATDLTGNPWRDGTDAGMRTKVAKIKPIANLAANDIRGVDASSYLALKNAGVKYYDFKGRETPLMKVLHDNGVNYLRLRIWNDPKNAAGKYYGGGNNDVATDLQIAKEATKYGMKVLLCFHYSDSWADPGKQILPKAWKADAADHVKMRQHVQDFTYQTVKQFVNAGVKVGMVQVGNEITKGAIGIWGTDWTKVWKNKRQSQLLDSYLKAGVKGVRGAAPKALVAFHLESPDVAKYQTIMNDWKRDGVDYDVLGTSFYPFWWNTTQRLHDIQNLAARYGKLFVVLETAWPHTLQNADGTANNIGSDTVMPHPYKISPQGQADQLAAMYQTLMNNPAANGLGAFYWEPAWIPVVPGWKNWQADADAAEKYGSGWIASPAQGYLPDGDLFFHGKPTWGGSSWDNNTLFDAQGHPLQSLKFYQKAVGNKRGLQLTRIKYVDQQGKLIRPMRYRRLKLGQKVKISPLKVNRYTALSKTRKVIGKTAGLVTIRFKYRDKPHAKIKQRVAVKQAMKGISRRKYRLYRKFYWKKAATQTYGQTFMVRYLYTTQSGSKYASLYTVRGKKWVGYLNVKGLKRTSLVGSAHRYGHRVKVTSRKYVLYRNFSWKKQSRKIYQRRFFAKYYYRHANGAQYYSLYTLTGNKWVGYVNTRAAVNVR